MYLSHSSQENCIPGHELRGTLPPPTPTPGGESGYREKFSSSVRRGSAAADFLFVARRRKWRRHRRKSRGAERSRENCRDRAARRRSIIYSTSDDDGRRSDRSAGDRSSHSLGTSSTRNLSSLAIANANVPCCNNYYETLPLGGPFRGCTVLVCLSVHRQRRTQGSIQRVLYSPIVSKIGLND